MPHNKSGSANAKKSSSFGLLAVKKRLDLRRVSLIGGVLAVVGIAVVVF